MRYQFFQGLPASQYELLKQDIAAHGVLVPIVVDEDGNVLDGHHRKKVCAELHIDCPRVVREGLSEKDKEGYVLSVNLFRRHLGGVERSQVIARLKVLGWSERRISEATGIAKSTVHDAVARIRPPEASGESSPAAEEGDSRVIGATGSPENAGEGDRRESGASAPPPRVTGRDGKSYAASKPNPLTEAEGEQIERTLAADPDVSAARVRAHLTGLFKAASFMAKVDAETARAMTTEKDTNWFVREAMEIAAWTCGFAAGPEEAPLSMIQGGKR